MASIIYGIELKGNRFYRNGHFMSKTNAFEYIVYRKWETEQYEEMDFNTYNSAFKKFYKLNIKDFLHLIENRIVGIGSDKKPYLQIRVG